MASEIAIRILRLVIVTITVVVMVIVILLTSLRRLSEPSKSESLEVFQRPAKRSRRKLFTLPGAYELWTKLLKGGYIRDDYYRAN